MSIFKKKDTFTDKELKRIEDKIKKAEPYSDEYMQLLEIRDSLLKQKPKKFKIDPDIVKVIVEGAVGFAGVAVNVWTVKHVLQEYRDIAALSYGLDDQLELCNGRVNNMKDDVMRLIPKK